MAHAGRRTALFGFGSETRPRRREDDDSSSLSISAFGVETSEPCAAVHGVSSAQTNLECELHEQMYSWEPDEDVWGSLKDREQTRRARAALIEAFDPSKPVSERSISHLEQALRILADVLGTQGATAWSDCNEAVGIRPDDQINL